MSRDTESKKSKDTLSTCDSSSEVSDEGYKSSQGNVANSASPNGGGRTIIDLSGKSACTNEASSHEGGKILSIFCIYVRIFIIILYL
jgi:hypothetical protein